MNEKYIKARILINILKDNLKVYYYNENISEFYKSKINIQKLNNIIYI